MNINYCRPAAKWYQQEAAYEHHLRQNLELHSPSNESVSQASKTLHMKKIARTIR